MKINIGCGNEKVEGYMGVDLYTQCDRKDDARTLGTFEDNSVEEIRTYHMLEHMKDRDVPLVIASMFRVLKHGGTLILEVPNLIWVLQNFLDTPDEDRWGFKLQTVFGLQTHDGEYHKTGFSKDRIHRMLKEAGFTNIAVTPVISKYYQQGVLDVTAMKP